MKTGLIQIFMWTLVSVVVSIALYTTKDANTLWALFIPAAVTVIVVGINNETDNN